MAYISTVVRVSKKNPHSIFVSSVSLDMPMRDLLEHVISLNSNMYSSNEYAITKIQVTNQYQDVIIQLRSL